MCLVRIQHEGILWDQFQMVFFSLFCSLLLIFLVFQRDHFFCAVQSMFVWNVDFYYGFEFKLKVIFGSVFMSVLLFLFHSLRFKLMATLAYPPIRIADTHRNLWYISQLKRERMRIYVRHSLSHLRIAPNPVRISTEKKPS